MYVRVFFTASIFIYVICECTEFIERSIGIKYAVDISFNDGNECIISIEFTVIIECTVRIEYTVIIVFTGIIEFTVIIEYTEFAASIKCTVNI